MRLLDVRLLNVRLLNVALYVEDLSQQIPRSISNGGMRASTTAKTGTPGNHIEEYVNSCQNTIYAAL